MCLFAHSGVPVCRTFAIMWPEIDCFLAHIGGCNGPVCICGRHRHLALLFTLCQSAQLQLSAQEPNKL